MSSNKMMEEWKAEKIAPDNPEDSETEIVITREILELENERVITFFKNGKEWGGTREEIMVRLHFAKFPQNLTNLS